MIGVLTKLIKTIIMLKNILELEGAQKLTKNEQKSIKGGAAGRLCPVCPDGTILVAPNNYGSNLQCATYCAM
jgi:hypothetical protein